MVWREGWFHQNYMEEATEGAGNYFAWMHQSEPGVKTGQENASINESKEKEDKYLCVIQCT